MAGLPNIGGILRELHPFLHYSERCKQAIKDVPMMAFRRPKSLEDYLVRAKLRPLVQNPGGNRGTHKCTSNSAMYAIIWLISGVISTADVKK